MRHLVVGLLALSFLLLSGCNSQGNSKPNFIRKAPPKAGVVAKIFDKEITEEQLLKGSEDDAYELEKKLYDLKEQKLNELALEEFINKDSRKTKEMTKEQFIEKFLSKGQKPTDAEVQKFITERQIPAQHVNDQLKERIKQYLEMESVKKAVEAYIAENTAKNPIEIYIDLPKRPIHKVEVGKAPTKGPADAKVTVVIFSEFQCPYCAQASKNLAEVEKKYGNKVRFAFKHFPLSFHQFAQKASEASMCANEQNGEKFWKMHDEMFADQTKLDEAGLTATAKKVGLDMTKFSECLKSGKYTSHVESDMKEGNELKLTATPTIFINGQMFVGGQPLEVYSEVIDAELGLK